MNHNTKEALTRWIRGANPKSANSFDRERFYNAIYEALIEGVIIDIDDITTTLRENLKWDEKEIEKFAEETEIKVVAIFGFIDYLKDVKKINIYNQM